MHVLATDLRRGKGCQLSPFDPPDPKKDVVARAKTAVNEKFGRVKVRSAATLYLPAFNYPQLSVTPNRFSGIAL